MALGDKSGIKTVYTRPDGTQRVTRSTYPNESMKSALGHMQDNDYGAYYCEVMVAETEVLLGRVIQRKNGLIEVFYDWDPTTTVHKYGASSMLKKG